jgi:hypothetical protein
MALKVLSSDMDLLKVGSSDRSSLKSEAGRFSEKSVRPLFCESPLKISHLSLINTYEMNLFSTGLIPLKSTFNSRKRTKNLG